MQGKFLPSIDNPRKATTAMCATVFDELDSALSLLDSVRENFNPLQRQLVGRFIAICKVFGHDMLAADGNPDALRVIFGLSTTEKQGEQAVTHPDGRALIDDVCTGACADLDRISSSVQRGLLEGVVDVIASIRAEQEDGSPDQDTLDVMASSVRNLAHQVAALFDAQSYALRRHQIVHQADLAASNAQSETAPKVTVEEFMQSVKPPVRRPTLRERLEPYILQLTQLRESGYSYAQCVEFLRENGISTYPGAISNVLWEARIRTTDSGKH